MSFSDEDIIAFLLGEAEESLAAKLRQSMAQDSELVARVNHFRSLLTHLDGGGDLYEPPGGLVESTMQRMLDIESSSTEPLNSSVGDQNVTAGGGPCRSSGGSARPGLLSTARLRNSVSSSSGYSWADSAALTISLMAMCCLLIPTMLGVRIESRRLQCADNLRINGQALIQYAIRCPDRRFPAVSQTGPEAFSGIYAVRLGSVGLLDSTSQLLCVSMKGPEETWPGRVLRLPSIEELHEASPYRLVQWQMSAGGDYAYNLGIIERHGLVAPKNNGSSHFAILADSPIMAPSRQTMLAHGGRGVNILYDDGHVQFICRRRLEQAELLDDHPFYNRLGDQEAGLDDHDASLAPSFFPPLSR